MKTNNIYSTIQLSILLIIMFLFQNVNSQTRKELATDYFNKSEKLKSSIASETKITVEYESSNAKITPITVFQNSKNGFVLIAGDDKSNFIVGYSDNGQFDYENISDGLKALISQYETKGIEDEGSLLKSGNIYPAISPLLDSKGISLNQFYHSEVGGSPSGCVVTAFTQIMLYHQFPNYGIGSHCYVNSRYGEFCADYENTFLDWKNMTSADYKQLSFNLGTAMEMSYHVSGSVPTTSNYEYALEEYYGYHIFKGSSNFDDIYYELECKRPVYVAVAGENSPGHAVVIDGVDSNGYYHFNFGWGGLDNGYFLIPGRAIMDHAGRIYSGYFSSVVNVSTTPFQVDENDIEILKTIATGLTENFDWDLSKDVLRWPGIYINRGRVKGINLSTTGSGAPYQKYATLSSVIEELSALESFSIHAKIDGIDINAFTKLTNLKKLSIQNYMKNDTKCIFPEEFGNLTKLKELEIQCLLEGEIPNSITNLTNLEILKLNSNYLTGTIPESIDNLNKLTELELAVNQLTGSIPNSIGNLTLLENLKLSENKLTGSVPASIGNLTKLLYFDLSSNQLSGVLPDEIGNITNTYSFLVNDNLLEGAVPSSISNLTEASWFSLANNRFTSLPDEIAYLELNELKVYGNKLKTLPASIFEVGKIPSISAFNNEIDSLPDNFGAKSRIGAINLSDNKLTEFPMQLCFVDKFSSIAIDNNLLTSLPDAIGNLGQLDNSNAGSLFIAGNQISGPIPTDLFSGSLNYIDFSSNKFIFGDIPETYSGEFYSGTQALVEIKDSIIKVFPDEDTILDIRKISRLHHPKNRYFWFEYPEMKTDILYQGDYSNDSPFLTINMKKGDEDKLYYCRVLNDDVPLIRRLDSQVIRISVMDEHEKLEALYPESELLYSDNIHSEGIKNQNITFVSPFEKRGKIIWQISTDNKNWKDLSEQMEESELFDNVSSMTRDALVIEPKLTAWYRCVLQEENCNPIISESIKASPYQEELLFSDIINVVENDFTVEVDSIKVRIPQGLNENSFKLSISKIHDAPPAPEGYKIGSVYDVTVDFAEEFNGLIEISLKNIDVSEVDDMEIPEIRPVYYDEKERRWVEYDNGGASFNNEVFFQTNHLTKLSWGEKIDAPTYNYKLENDKVKVIYKYSKFSNEFYAYNEYQKKHNSNSSDQSWHESETDPEKGGAPYMIQDIAHYMKEIITKIDIKRTKPIIIPQKFIVYVGDLGSNGALGYISAAGYAGGYFYLNTNMATDIDDVRRTLAHEYMHFVQSFDFNVLIGNYFFAEAHAPLADRVIWNESELKDTEPEINLMEARGESKYGQSIFDLLSQSWDAGTTPFGSLLEKFRVKSGDANISSSFLHYIRSYSKPYFDPVDLSEYTLLYSPFNFTWRTYLDYYLSSFHSTTLGKEYDKYLRYIFTGENKNFTVLNVENGNPYSYLLNNAKKDGKGTYVDKYVWNFIDEEDKDYEVKLIKHSIPYLGSKVVFFQNNTTDKPVVINYKRYSDVTENDVIYYCHYDFEKKRTTFEEITDKEEFALLLDNNSEVNEEKYNNLAFLLFVNKRCPAIYSVFRDFDINFVISATPVTNITDIVLVNVGDGAIHTYDDGSKGDYIISGKIDFTYFSSFEKFKITDFESNKYMFDENTFVTESKFKDSWQVPTGSYLPNSINEREIWQTVFYNYVTGDMKIMQKTIHKQSWGKYTNYSGTEIPGYTHTVITSDQQLDLTKVFIFEEQPNNQFYGKHYSFESRGSEHTQEILKNISDVITTTEYDSKGNVTEEKTRTLVGSDYSGGNQKIEILIHY